MGNGFSTSSKSEDSNKFDNFYEVMDYIATHYILTMDFESMSKLSEPEYCDKLVIITSDIIKKYFNDLDITYLAQRVKNGEEVNELAKEKVSFVSKDALENLDIKNDVNKSIKKKRVCIGIAKFYVKIAHVFAAILTTINPVYMYKDAEGNNVEKGLMEKGNIPTNVPREVLKTNICDNRIKRLNPLQRVARKVNNANDLRNNDLRNNDLRNNDLRNPSETPINGGFKLYNDNDYKDVYINPKVCELNLDASGKPMMLSDEPGMNELMMLYMDDDYDYSNGTFKGMSDKMKYQFERDLKIFYTAFTGNKDMPDTIKKFSDIKLRTYDKTNGCKRQDDNKSENLLKTGTMISINDELFKKYAKNLNNMIYNAQSNQQKLLSVINDLFVFVAEPYGGENSKKIRINPKLTDESLDSLIINTRNIIIELYVRCEKDFENGIHIYEAIVERQILETTKSQLLLLLKTEENILKTSNLNQSEPIQQESESIKQSEPMEQEPMEQESIKQSEPMEQESIKQSEPIQQSEPMEQESIKQSEPMEQESIKQLEPMEQESIKQSEPMQQESIKQLEPIEPMQQESIKQLEPIQELKPMQQVKPIQESIKQLEPQLSKNNQ